jgi:hypothetical protein
MSDTSSRSAFHWNLGGWLGAQLGSTLWLFLLAFVTMGKDAGAGLALFGAGLAANGVGFLLWTSRARLRPYVALQLLIAAIGASTLAAFLVLDAKGLLAGLDPRIASTRTYYGLLAIYPGLMLLFALRERAARRASA